MIIRMIIRVMSRSWLMLLLAVAPIAYAANSPYDGGELEVDEVLIPNATMITGRIRSLDFGDRIAVISGFEYHLGSSGGIDRCVVRMLGQGTGAVELLQNCTDYAAQVNHK